MTSSSTPLSLILTSWRQTNNNFLFKVRTLAPPAVLLNFKQTLQHLDPDHQDQLQFPLPGYLYISALWSKL